MFSQYVIDGIGAGIGLCIFALIPLAFFGALHEAIMGRRIHKLRIIKEANEQIVALRKIDTGYQKDSDCYLRSRYLYC